MKSIRLVLTTGILAVALLLPQPSVAAKHFQITSCPYTADVANAIYTVTSQLYVRGGDCLDVTAPGITIQVNGQTISSNGAYPDYAIHIYPDAKHAHIVGPGTVYNTILDEGDSALIEDLTIGQNVPYYPAVILQSVKESVVKNDLTGGFPGIWLSDAKHNTVEGNTVTNQGGDQYSPIGILLMDNSSHNRISNNNTSQNGIGIEVGCPANWMDPYVNVCPGRSGGWSGCLSQEPSVGNIITGNTSNSNQTYPDGHQTPMMGIWLTCNGARKTIVEHNTALHNFNYDAYDGNGHCKSGTWKDNKLKNVYPSCILGLPPKEKPLYMFQEGADGTNPTGGLVFDKAGNLYGMTSLGGTGCGGKGCGTVFKLSPSNKGWTTTTIYEFTGTNGDGSFPLRGGLIFDEAGTLYGETSEGGLGFGTVFELSPNSDGSWAETVIYEFTGGAAGAWPSGGLTFDQAGNLYGTAGGGIGSRYKCEQQGTECGTVFQLQPGSGGTWSGHVIYSFKGGPHKDGVAPEGAVAFDAQGNLYGTTYVGGTNGEGTVYKLTPGKNGTWSESVIHSFANDKNGRAPVGGVVLDKAGNIFGTTWRAGSSDAGTVFELSPTSGGDWKFKLLHTFTDRLGGPDVGFGMAAPILDSEGSLYGTEAGPGFNGAPLVGGVFKLTPQAGRKWKETVLYHFGGGPDGSYPTDSLVLDEKGNLFGTTYAGGAGFCVGNDGCGVVFEVKK